MNPNPVVLIVSSAFGDGHAKVAQAIEQSFRSRGVARVHVMDLFGEVHPFLNELSRVFYLKSAAYAPGLYGNLYRMTSRMKPDYPFGQLLHSMGKNRVRRILGELRPDLIIHTFPYLAASQLVSDHTYSVPVFTVLTDYCLHGRWIHPRTAKYFIGTESVRDELLKAGVEEEKIMVSGIPVRPEFAGAQDRKALAAKYGLREERKYLLLSAGAYGVTPRICSIIRSVLEGTDFDILVLCGNNAKLKLAVTGDFGHNGRVRIFGYTNEIHELMSLSDCLLTKAGGVTITEAFAMSLPVIIYRPLPGQEAGNAKALRDQQALSVVRNERELLKELRLLQKQPVRGDRVRRMNAISRKDAAGRIVGEVLKTLEVMPSYAKSLPSSASRQGQPETAHR